MFSDSSSELKLIHNKLVDIMLFNFTLLFLPLIITSAFRIMTTGITVIQIAIVPIFLCFITLYIFKNKLTFIFKVSFILIMLFVAALLSYYSYGLIGIGTSLLIIINILMALFSTRKLLFITSMFSVFIISVFGFVITNRLISFNFDLENYFYAPSSWVTQVVGFCILTISTTFIIRKMMSLLKTSMHQELVSKEYNKTMIDALDDMIFSISIDGHLLSANHSFLQKVGLDHDYLIGKHFSLAFSPFLFTSKIQVTDWINKINVVANTQKIVQFQFEFKNLKGITTFTDIKLIPIKDDDGSVKSLICNCRDITEIVETKMQIEDLLRAEKEELENIIKEKTHQLEETFQDLIKSERLASLGSLVAGVSHEINTPLGVAVTAGSYLSDKNKSISELLAEEKLTKTKLVDYISSIDETSKIINTSLERAVELIRSFKEISVTQSSELHMSFNLSSLLNSVITTLKHEYKNTKTVFKININPLIWLDSYPGAFSQIFTNLIMNSLTHAFPKDYDGLIEIECYEESESIVLTYQDNGVGINDDNMAHIFDPFFTTNRSKGGSGLGMSIVYNIVTDQLDAHLKCDSAPGEGFTLTITLGKDIVIEKGVDHD